jgi:hypothetical protein
MRHDGGARGRRAGRVFEEWDMTDHQAPSPTERLQAAEHLKKVEPYGKPRRVWVEDGHVFVEGHDGTVVSMTPEVAIELGRLIADAGADSLMNKIMEREIDLGNASRR